jgi:hypothetical protein
MSIAVEQVNLVEAVGYQTGAVVSKTLVDKKVGTITLFAFDKGQGLMMRWCRLLMERRR